MIELTNLFKEESIIYNHNALVNQLFYTRYPINVSKRVESFAGNL